MADAPTGLVNQAAEADLGKDFFDGVKKAFGSNVAADMAIAVEASGDRHGAVAGKASVIARTDMAEVLDKMGGADDQTRATFQKDVDALLGDKHKAAGEAALAGYYAATDDKQRQGYLTQFDGALNAAATDAMREAAKDGHTKGAVALDADPLQPGQHVADEIAAYAKARAAATGDVALDKSFKELETAAEQAARSDHNGAIGSLSGPKGADKLADVITALQGGALGDDGKRIAGELTTDGARDATDPSRKQHIGADIAELAAAFNRQHAASAVPDGAAPSIGDALNGLGIETQTAGKPQQHGEADTKLRFASSEVTGSFVPAQPGVGGKQESADIFRA